jgi:outer membrane protein TolC
MLHKIIFLLVSLSSGLYAQSVLTIEDAIKVGLEKNYSVMIVKNQQEITKLQNNFGNAGMSPTVSVNANLALANVNSHQEFNTGVVQEKNGAQSNNLGASVNVGWMVFDGLKMFAVKKRLSQNEQLSAFALKQQMENTIYEIISSYYSIVKINELIKSDKQNLSIYEERKKIAKLKL